MFRIEQGILPVEERTVGDTEGLVDLDRTDRLLVGRTCRVAHYELAGGYTDHVEWKKTSETGQVQVEQDKCDK